MSDVTDLIERAQFLCDRLDELEWHDGNLEDGLRDYMGHVDPAHARLKAALERLTRPADDERTAVLQCKRVNDAIQTALERGELTITGEGWLATIKQTDAEAERDDSRLRSQIKDIINEHTRQAFAVNGFKEPLPHHSGPAADAILTAIRGAK